MSSVYYGQNSEFIAVSKSHGPYSLGFVESFDVDVSHTNKRLYFFGKKEALTVSIFEGVSGRFGFLETEEKYLAAAIMDIDPSTFTVINDDPSAYYEFNLVLNVKNEEGIIENGMFIKGCRVTGLPESLAPREEQHGNISYIGATRYKMKGGAIQYSRIVSTSPAYTTTGDIVAAELSPVSSPPGPAVASLVHVPISVNIENNTTSRMYLAIYKNGKDITKDTVAMANVSIPVPSGSPLTGTVEISNMAATDVYDIYTVYKP